MIIEQIYTKCLAEAAYYIESNGEVAIIDPLRETAPYIEKANANNAKIKYIFETHFHADFVSGHVDLAKETGATIVYGPGAKTNYEIHEGKDGEVFQLGNISIKLLHTPGHTLESSTFLLIDEKGKEHAIFSGDTLFIGDVGRPDLAIKSNLTEKDLAGMLYVSLRNKIMPLPDSVTVYPAHGAGSACGKNMSSETYDTLGNQKATNYALREGLTKEDFINELLDGILPPPQYFAKNAALNKQGYKPYADVMKDSNKALELDAFEKLIGQEDVLLLDVRHQDDFVKGFIPKSMFIGLNGGFAPWVGALINDLDQKIVLISPEGKEGEAINRLSRVGYDNVLGYLKGGFNTWESANKIIDKVDSISPEEFVSRMSEGKVIDVRKPGEYDTQHITDAISLPLDFIETNWTEIPKDGINFIHCAGGYRSVIASSIYKARGLHNFIDVKKGFRTLKDMDICLSDSTCMAS